MALSATYTSAYVFVVAGDNTPVFVGGRAVRVDCGIDGIKICYVAKSVYGAPNTTVTLLQNDSDAITSNIQTVEVSNLKSNSWNMGNLPIEIVWMNRGLRKFFLHTWNAAGTLGITPGYLHINDGSREKILTVETALTKAISALSNNTWYYIYVTAPANDYLIVTDAEITVSTTAPTWNESYVGWYNSNSRCIGFFKTNASGTMRYFQTDGHYQRFNNGTTKTSNVMVANVWTLITLDLPAFSYLLGEINCTTQAEINATYENYLKAVGDLDGTQAPIHRVSVDNNVTCRHFGFNEMIRIDSNKQFYFFSSSTPTVQFNCNGVYLPRGMACW